MNRFAMFAWLAAPVGLLAWHQGPGRDYLARDEASSTLTAATSAAEREDWSAAAREYTAALEMLPPDTPLVDRQQIQLARARARIQAGEMLEGQADLEQLVVDLSKESSPAPELLTATRHELASASYFAAWLLRLEGATAEEWKPEAERARQQFRLLAEQGTDVGQQPQMFAQNLEATIRLEQMDLSELMARPLPKQCPNSCQNLCQRKRKQRQSQCKLPGQQEGKKPAEQDDARKQIKQQRGAGLFNGGNDGS